MSERIGKIAKGVGGLYFVYDEEGTLYECKPRGKFRNDNIKPLVGDNVRIETLSGEGNRGTIEEILPRQNELLRPASANLDQILIVFACAKPAPNLDLLDRFLLRMQLENIPVLLGFSKCELITEEEKQETLAIYRSAGYSVSFFSVFEKVGLSGLSELLKGKTTAVAGPSGVGKSSLINCFCPDAGMETGEISRKIERGKHTTRHAEIFSASFGGYLMDTPGFSTLFLNEIEAKDLWKYFPEMQEEEKFCRFTGCSHMEEPDCGVKNAVLEGRIAKTRYESYRRIYQELAKIRRF